MSNHFHLLLEVREAPAARIMQSLVTGYVRRFNAVHRQRGHLFQGRYKAMARRIGNRSIGIGIGIGVRLASID